MIASIIRSLTGGLASEIRGAYRDRLAATNDSERLEAEQRIAQLEARRDALASGGRLSAIVQAAWALPFIVYNAKLLLFDKVLGLGTTDPLSPELYQVQMIIVGFYFLSRMFK